MFLLQNKVDIEREQEAKLKAKYGMLKKPGGGSAFLQKRLQKGVGSLYISVAGFMYRGYFMGVPLFLIY